MQRASECKSVVSCGAAARLRRAAALCSGGGQPAGLAAAQNLSLHLAVAFKPPLASGKGEVGSFSGPGLSEKHFARISLLAELREIFSLEKVGL